MMGLLLFLSIGYSLFSSLSYASVAVDTLTPNQSIAEGETLVSSGRRFEFGFFSPGQSSNRYLGIWYKDIPLTVVWVANRDNPISNSSGILVFTNEGKAQLLNSTNHSIWSSDYDSADTHRELKLQLLDTGNLVMINGSGYHLWESFDSISNTLLPGMKLGWNLKTGLHRFMSSWTSPVDPSEGEFTFSLDPPYAPQLILRQGTQKLYRWGPWDGVRFSGSRALRTNAVFTPMVVSNTDEIYYTFQLVDNSVLSRFIVNDQGAIQYLLWRSNSWVTMVTLQRENCDKYKLCGAYGNCYSTDPSCQCLSGFAPKSQRDWELFDWTGGCKRKYDLDCGSNQDGFVKYGGLKLPDSSSVWPDLSPEKCREDCLKNCSCMAYTNINVDGRGRKCVVWLGELIDMRNFPSGGEELYIRMARSELKAIANAKRRKLIVQISIIILSVGCGIILLGLIRWYISRVRRAKKHGEAMYNPHSYFPREEAGNEEDLELPLFDLATIAAATNDFAFQNKIGQGGFGVVYKGELPTGQEIAVKRLSQGSGQGLKEFKNEVILIAKLQHRNLVKLLGCCIHREERMLVYEYLPNKGLDSVMFDQNKRELLTWKIRYDIILGIARGLLYLHQDSRLRIIHRDLKTSNILLDKEMNPKISDFGIARIFGGEQTEEKTLRVIGTYGYMSPEYAMSGHFSVKSDVFSFGVLVLEIINGKKNWGFYHPDHDLNLLGHAWKLWSEGNAMDLVDPMILDSFSTKEVIRCIHVALLCVQQRAKDRPAMAAVVVMLANESVLETQPKEPGFCTDTSSKATSLSWTGQDSVASNNVTVTALDGR